MKIIVTGSNGLLGQHLVPKLTSCGHEVLALGKGPCRVPGHESVSYHDLDLLEFKKVRELISTERPDVLVHSAAMTQVDDCERNRDKCREINVDATENLLEASHPAGSHFIFLSTDFVFDGTKGNYREEDATGPVNWYGKTKCIAEELTKKYPGAWSIARTCLLYGIARYSSRTNIISWIRTSLEKGQRIRVVNDQVRTPTDVNDFAAGIQLILEKKSAGIFHLSGEEVVTPYQLALAAAGLFSLDKSLIEAVDASTFSQPAKRPLKTGFIIEKAQTVLGFSPVSLRSGLLGTGI
jgi:dTDP-4-dehydrorhamnose reductase